jgi:hypothetical protein
MDLSYNVPMPSTVEVLFVLLYIALIILRSEFICTIFDLDTHKNMMQSPFRLYPLSSGIPVSSLLNLDQRRP